MSRFQVDLLEAQRWSSWHNAVGKPWCNAIQARAQRDGLRIACRQSGSGPLYDDWRARDSGVNFWAVAALLKPDGSQYHRRLVQREEIQEEMLADWGETLAGARRRADPSGVE